MIPQKSSLLHALLASSVAISFLAPVHAQTYSCPADQCRLPSCYCASKNPPGGLSPRNIPQFVTLTLDDAITGENHPVIMSAIGNNNAVKNPNGCPIAATFFVSTLYTDYSLAQKTYTQGNEIAAHTMNHPVLPSYEEIQGSRDAISAWAGVPKSEIRGFRTPFLNFTTETLQSVRATGEFLYDSSMPVLPGAAYWPYTLDFGPASTCSTGVCDNMKLPGLWEIPIYTLMNDDGSVNTSIDPNPLPGTPFNATNLTTPNRTEVVRLWRNNFDATYNGDRTPFGVYLHVLWMLRDREERIRALQEFIAYTMEKGDVYWVTNQQLLAWILNPTDIAGSRNNPALGCKNAPTTSSVCDGLSTTSAPSQCTWTDADIIGGYYQFSTCFGCPTRPPNATKEGPVPPLQGGGNACFVPYEGCPNEGQWDPKACACVTVQRVADGVRAQRSFANLSAIPEFIPSRLSNNNTNGTGNGGNNNSNQTNGGSNGDKKNGGFQLDLISSLSLVVMLVSMVMGMAIVV